MRHWSDWIPPICCGIGATMWDYIKQFTYWKKGVNNG